MLPGDGTLEAPAGGAGHGICSSGTALGVWTAGNPRPLPGLSGGTGDGEVSGPEGFERGYGIAAGGNFSVVLEHYCAPGVACDCFFDLNGDETVDGAELTVVLAAWGTSGPEGDINDDGMVDGTDVTLILAAWGPCFP